MKNEFLTVTLLGHRDLCEHLSVERQLYSLLSDLINSGYCIDILIGRNGEFDVFCASVIKRIQRELGKENISETLVLPYKLKDLEFYEKYYDGVVILDTEKTYPKGRIELRNRFMIERSDLVICYVNREKGGACAALKYAKKLNKRIINLASPSV